MSEPQPRKAINVRRGIDKTKIANKMSSHFHSELIDSITAQGNVLRRGNTAVYLAAAFGFCDGVRRAVDIAYSTREYFPTERVWIIGEIIHNPEVNARLAALDFKQLPWQINSPEYDQVEAGDVVVIPAFGVTVGMRKFFSDKGAQLVDTTCGNVVKVWHKVRTYAKLGVTSIIHGKCNHEESMATASQSRGEAGDGRFLMISNENDAHALAGFITGQAEAAGFRERFTGAFSAGFDPTRDLQLIGMANQTTMLQKETARIQQILREAVIERDGDDSRFQACDTICGATQDRQNALAELLDQDLDAMVIVGGYNSSNTSHLAHIASRRLPTYFINSASCILSMTEVRAFNLESKQEELLLMPPGAADLNKFKKIGVTAGASCPANIIDEVITRLFELRS